MMKNMFHRILLGVALAVTLIGVAGPAAAAQKTESVTTSATMALTSTAVPTALNVQRVDSGGYIDLAALYGKYLPTDRWQASSGAFHSRFDQFLQTDVVALTQRNITEGLGMIAGNGFYGATQGILNFSLTLSPMNLLGEQADHIAAIIGNALFNVSGIVVGAVVLVVLGFVFQMLRSGARPWKRIATTAGLVALFVVMLAGANASTTVGGVFQPGLGSPGWFATKINSSITTLATAPAQALVVVSPAAANSIPAGSGCAPYLTNLASAYAAGYGSNGGGSIPQIVASLWSSTGLTVWKQTQYSATPIDEASKTGETYGDSIFCHQLDWQAGISAKDQIAVTFGTADAAKKAGAVSKSYAWGVPGDSDMEDRSMIAWAACVNDGSGHFTVRPHFSSKSGQSSGEWITAKQCADWWSGTDTSLGSFNIGGKASDITEQFTDDPGVVDFVQTLHGNQTNAGVLLVVTYNFSAFLIMLVFGGLGIAVIFAKFAGVVMLVAVFFVLITSIASKQDMGSKLMGFLKTYIGFSVFAFSATLILALVTLLSKMISDTGTAVFTAGSLMALIWTGLSPVVACFMLHLIFTKIFKVPSVFKPSSALAWGAAGGAVGGIIGSSVVNRAQSRVAGAARGLGQRAKGVAGNYAKGKIGGAGGRAPGGRTERRGMMAPAGGGGIAGGGGVAGVGAATAAAAAAASDLTNNQVRAQKFDKKLLSDAKKFDRGLDPTVTPPTRQERKAERLSARAERVAQSETAPKLIGEAKEAHRLARSAARAASSNEFRGRLRAARNGAGNAMVGLHDGTTLASARATIAASGVAQAARHAVKNPGMATGILAERTGNAFKNAASATATGIRYTASGASTLVSRANTPVARTVARSAGKIVLGAVVGTMVAGPMGAVAGVGIATGRVRHSIHTHTSREDARKVAAWAAHTTGVQESASADSNPRQ